jgi:TonB family protein
MILGRCLLACLSLCLPLFSTAQPSPKQLAHDLKGKILLLRGKYVENNLTFDSQGNLTGDATPGPFSVSAIKISKGHVSRDSLELEGRRGALIYIGKTEPIETSQIEFIPAPDAVHIVINLDSAPPDALGALLAKIFAVSIDDALANRTEEQRTAELFTVASLAPTAKVRSSPAPHNNNDAEKLNTAGTQNMFPILKPGGGVSPPRVLYSIDPEFTDEARKSKISGICVVSVIVDPSGFPIHIRIAKPLGAGLDQNAVAAVSQYRFEPARFRGLPVAAEVYIEVTYKIY